MAKWAATLGSVATLGFTSSSKICAPSRIPARLEGARESSCLKRTSRSRPATSCASCRARAAYLRICTVSRPEISEKNQPQLVYMSIDWRCISSSFSAVATASSSGSTAA